MPAPKDISLRDYMAGQALAGWMASFGPTVAETGVDQAIVAKFAYAAADAMLVARDVAPDD